MRHTVTSLARTLLDPGAACRTVSASITGTRHLVNNVYMQYVQAVCATVRKTKDVACYTKAVAVGGVQQAARPLLWPVTLSLDLSRRVLIQVLVTLREVLATLNELVTSLETKLSQQGLVEQMEIPAITGYLQLKLHEDTRSEDGQSETEEDTKVLDYRQDDGKQEKEVETGREQAAESRDQALVAWKQHVALMWRLKQTNVMLKRRVTMTETKYETINAQVTALKDLYRDKMADMEFDLCDLKKQRRNITSMIEAAQTLAQDCRGDVQRLMQDVHSITTGKKDDVLSATDSLSVDFSLECLTLMSQQKDWQTSNDGDTGFMDDDMDSDDPSLSLPLPLRRLPHRTHADLSATSSVTSLSSLDASA